MSGKGSRRKDGIPETCKSTQRGRILPDGDQECPDEERSTGQSHTNDGRVSPGGLVEKFTQEGTMRAVL